MSTFTITPYQRRHRHAASDLLFYSHYAHTHLDWHDPEDWLDRFGVERMRLAWQDGELAGMLATSEPLNDAYWIRILAFSNEFEGDRVLAALWDSVARQATVREVNLLIAQEWLKPKLKPLDFHAREEIITLHRVGQYIPNGKHPPLEFHITQPEDLPLLLDIDNRAFQPPWQLTYNELRQAQRIAAQCTVAQLDGQPVGYQLSTLYRTNAHLARLAVLPEAQGFGIGGGLLGDVLARFHRRGIYGMTVNTQASNKRSQRLYKRYGFRRNGYDLPVWSALLTPP